MIQSPAMIATRDLYTKFIDGWNAMDARAIAACLAPDALLIGFDGSRITGRVEIERNMAMIFADHQPHRFYPIERFVRMLAPTVGIYSGDIGCVPRGGHELDERLNARQVLVAGQSEEGWRAHLLQSTPAALHGQDQERLALNEELRQTIARATG